MWKVDFTICSDGPPRLGLPRAPRPSLARKALKELNSEASLDLDAGWDELVPDSTFVSVKMTSRNQIVAVEELDAGWEIEEPEASPQPPRQPTSSGFAAPTGARALSKKERRELERRQRVHEAKRRSEAKELRKLQRRAEQTHPPEPTTPNLGKQKPAVAAPSALRNKDPVAIQRSQPKSKARAKSQSGAKRLGPENLPQPRLDDEHAKARNVSDSITANGNQSRTEIAVHAARWRASRWWAIDAALLLLVALGIALLR